MYYNYVDCSFTILIHTTKEAAASLDHDQQAQVYN